MMFVKIIAILTISHLTWTQDLQNVSLTDIFNDALPQLDLLQSENEILHQKLSLLDMSIHQQLMSQQNELMKNLNELLISIVTLKKSPFMTDCSNSGSVEIKRQSIELNATPRNCAEALQKSGRTKGVHKIKVTGSELKAFYIFCLTNSDNDDGIDDSIIADVTTAWTIIQRRRDGSVNFNRKWVDYQQGFGNVEGEYFIGLDKLHEITQSSLHELWIQLEDFEGDTRWAKYSSFAIGSESEGYPINVLGSYSGDAGNSLIGHIAQKFSTKDMDNDTDENRNCANSFLGGWWYINCFYSELNGYYYKRNTTNGDKGILWNGFRGNKYSLKYAHMAIRPIP